MLQDPKRTHEEEPQEELLTWVLKIWKSVEDNSSKIVVALGVAVVAALIVIFVQRQSAADEKAAQEALGEVYISLFKGEVSSAISKSQQVLSEFPDKSAAQEALMAMANLNFEEGRIDEARAQFQQYLDKYGSEGPLGYGAWTGLAACLEQEGNFAEAASRFAGYAEKHPKQPFAAVALKEAGRCYELAGNLDQAQQIYQRIMDDYAASSVANTARGRLLMMGVDVAS